jgi:hypothetical protein
MCEPIVKRFRVPLREDKTRAAVFLRAFEGGSLPQVGYCDCSICRADGDCCGCYVPSAIRLSSVSRRKGVATFRVRYNRNF